ncbi:hypothetical protein [Burkholderia diffusa]|uniref:hypothetical protein n=1 Tax=Burkholderia diffusa TaxID=488732 RepID=UPI0020C6EE3B|nr:hypothetical protein [Burkholderia diffusa]
MADDDRDRALADSFKKDGRFDPKMKGALDGSRYLADGFAQGKTWSSFAHSYAIQMTDRITTAGKAVRVLATPVTLAADGVMMAGAVVLLPASRRCPRRPQVCARTSTPGGMRTCRMPPHCWQRVSCRTDRRATRDHNSAG